MSGLMMRRAVAATSGAALAVLGLGVGGGVASAAPGSVTWDDGSERITRTISDVTPAAGDTITSTTVFDRTGGVVEYIQQVKDIHPPCLTYVDGSAKVDGSPRGLDSQGADFAKVAGSWALYPHISPNLRTFEFSYKVGADCARGVPLMTTVHYSGTLGSGTYDGKGPTVSVRKNASTTTLAPVPAATVGQGVQLTATVAGGAAGNVVEFYDGAAKIGEGPLVGSSVTVGWTPSTAGAHNLSAKFLATATAEGSQSAPQSVTVSAPDAATTTTLTVPATANVGAAVELKATVAPAAAGGTVQFKDGAANIGGPVAVNAGVATLSHTFDAAGAKSITAVYSGGAGFTGSTSAPATVTVSVPDEATTTTVTVPATANVGAAVELKATVAPAAAGGTVQFKDGAANIGGPVALAGGVATLSHAFDAAGAKSITAVYSGGAGFTGSTSAAATVTVSVPDEATTTTITVPATANVGAAVELKATVAPAAAGGTVQFKDGAANIGGPVTLAGGVATLSHTFDAAGAKSITAVYSGGAGFTGSTSAAATVFVSVPDEATTTTVTVPATANVGAAVELKATVSPAAAGGTVQFKDGATNIGGPVTLAGGVATLSHTFDAAGAKSITAVYSGGAGFTGSTSAAATVFVSVPDEATTTTVTVPATANVGAAVELKATVSPAAAGGTVQFKDGATNIGGPVTLAGGVATLSHTFDAAGAKSITAVYSGGAGFTGSTSPAATVTVSVADVATSTQLTVPATAFVGAAVDLKATVAPAPAGGTVQFKNGDLALGAPVNVVDGKAVLSHTFAAAGAHAISAVFSGAPGFLGSTSAVQSVSVPVPDVVTSIALTAPATADRGVVVEFSATVSPTPNGGTVQFKDGSTPIGGPVNVVDGKAKLSHTFDTAGAHSITATYSGFAGFSGAGSQASTVTVAGAGGDGSFGSSQFGS
ncbi:beta strand repeat-containing protein [Rhodococcus maanshanensis]|uniref:Ig-like domain (Group 3) n=1 Tax=Rhodococcus maanshanensis TaxID=183556 RepID=A0A1H7KPA6_9NOCA|nr:Ig-like domain-containing protein [Rhodococcus maanshanensis]SEK88360.1 Ig-like domain (group 3) [Rhodococcus maanshanensis]